MTSPKKNRPRPRASTLLTRSAVPTGPRRLGGAENRPSSGARRAANPRAKRWDRPRSTFLAATVGLGALIVILVLLLGGSPSLSPSEASDATVSGPPGPEGVPREIGRVLAPAAGAANGQTVDGIGCDSSEQVAYHVHTHLSVYVDGVLRPLPPGIGIVSPVAEHTPEGPFYAATRCYYFLHVHAQDGVIHIESPTERSYTLGQFFDIWRQPLSRHQVGPATGPLTIYVDGRRYFGNPRDIALSSHEDIQIDLGRPVVAPKKVDWAKTQL